MQFIHGGTVWIFADSEWLGLRLGLGTVNFFILSHKTGKQEIGRFINLGSQSGTPVRLSELVFSLPIVVTVSFTNSSVL